MSKQLTPAQQAFVDAFDQVLSECPDTALVMITGMFVATTLGVTEAHGYDTTKEVFIDGGKERDITIHAPKLDIGTGF